MILNYSKFYEGLVEEIRQYDRVICHGSLKYYDEEAYHIDIEGKTGIVAEVKLGGERVCGVIFDNCFTKALNNLNMHNIKINRALWISEKHLEKVPYPPSKGLNKTWLSDKLRDVMDYVEFIPPFRLRLDINYIDVTDKNDTVSYISNDRLDRLGSEDDQWKNNLRQEMKIGKFIQLINPYTDQPSLEKKINLYKATYNNIVMKNFSFTLVMGETVLKFYDEASYQEGAGSLNKSCMRNKLDRLNLYKDNPNKVKLLVMLNEEGKVAGRALVWNVDESYPMIALGKSNITYMDRPYVVYQQDIYLFEEYAKKNGWKYYEKGVRDKMIVYMGHDCGYPEENPYMDTFYYFYNVGPHGKFYLTNHLEEEDEDGEVFNDYYEYDQI